MLRLDGLIVDTASDGRSAIRALVSNLPDLLVIDTRLPDVAGLDVVRVLRQATGGDGVAVVVLSDDAARVATVAHSLRLTRVVPKPVSLLDLADLIRAIARDTEDGWSPPDADPERAPPPTVLDLPKPAEAMAPTPAAPAAAPAPTPAAAPAPAAAAARPSPASVRVVAPPANGRIVPPPAASAAAVAQLVVRLKREVKLVEEADPWTALGVPRKSPAGLVRKAVARARERYGPLGQHASPEIRALAARVLARVEAAAADTGVDLSVPAPDEGMEDGRALLDRAEWVAADAWFEGARDARPDSAYAMAALGWARFHNPELHPRTREEDGLALIELAITFDRSLPDAWYYLAAIAARRGDAGAALGHVQRALKLDPVHAGAARLLRELRAATVPSEGA